MIVLLFVTEFIKGALMVSILPVYMSSVLGLSAYLIGWAFALEYIGDNLFRSPVGWLIDKIGYRYTMQVGLVLTFAAVGLFAMAEHTLWLIIGFALLGIGTSPLWPSVISGVTEVAGERGRATVMSSVYIAWISGVGAGPIVINFFAEGTYGFAFRILIVLVVAINALAFTLPARPISKKAEGKDSMQENGSQAPKVVGKPLKSRIIQYVAEIRESIQVSVWFFPAMFLYTLSIGLLAPVVTLYIRDVMGMSGSQFSLLLIVGGGVAILLMLPIGRWVDRWGTTWFLHFGFALTGFALFLLTVVRTIPLLYVNACLLGLSYALTIPAWNALIASAVPSEKRGAVWGFYLTIEGSGMIVGPIVSGVLWDNVGPYAPFAASGVIMIMLLIVHIFISNGKKIVVR